MSKKSSEARRSPAVRQRNVRPILKKMETIGTEGPAKCARQRGLRVRFGRQPCAPLLRAVDEDDPTIAKLVVRPHGAPKSPLQSPLYATRFFWTNGCEADRKLLHAVLDRFQKTARFKSEECRSALLGEKCAGGRSCSYAHNDAEKMQPREHPLFKSVACRLFATDGHCPLGDCCHYLHDENAEALGFIRRLKLDAIPRVIDVLLHAAGIARPCRRLERQLNLWLDSLIRKSNSRALEELSGSYRKQITKRQPSSSRMSLLRSTPRHKSTAMLPPLQQQTSGYSSDVDESPESKFRGSRDVEDVEKELLQRLSLGAAVSQSTAPPEGKDELLERRESVPPPVRQAVDKKEHQADSGVEETSAPSDVHTPIEAEGTH